MYNSFKARSLGKIIGDGECVSLIVNNSLSYTAALFPGVTWTAIFAPVSMAKQLANKGNSYLTWIVNNHSDPNQIPVQGDIMIFDATPQAGYTDTFNNPDGHCGVCDSASSTGYSLLQQNAPAFGSPVNVTPYKWNYRPCLGWYHPVNIPTPVPSPAPVPPNGNAGKTLFLPDTTGPWHLYNDNGPYIPADAKAILYPSKFPPGLSYKIITDKGNGIYVINTQDFGQGALYTAGSDVKIS